MKLLRPAESQFSAQKKDRFGILPPLCNQVKLLNCMEKFSVVRPLVISFDISMFFLQFSLVLHFLHA